MQDQLFNAYKDRLTELFDDTKTHLASKDIGAEKIFISYTVPFMILETWRENGHANDISMLDETVRNVALATMTSFFGWEKNNKYASEGSLRKHFSMELGYPEKKMN